MSAQQSDEAATQQSQQQVVHERIMGEVSDVLLNLEHALDRTRKALKVASKSGAEPNVEHALDQAVKDLDRLRKRLMQDAYFSGDVLRLL